MKFKNDKERIAFLEGYKDEQSQYSSNWSIWKQDDILGRRIWSTHVGMTIFFVEEEFRTFEWPKRYRTWHTVNWYVYEGPMTNAFSGEMTFGDRRASRTMVLARLKELEREER